MNSSLIINNKEEEFLEAFNIKYKESLKNIINETIFSVKDPFYFNFLYKCFLSDNRNYNFVLEIISYIINLQNIFFHSKKENDNKRRKINKKCIYLFIYIYVFF